MSLKEFDLSGRVALVTGAGKGLGEQIALALAEAGADVGLAGRNLKNLNRVADRIRTMGRKALAIQADVSKAKDVARMGRSAIKHFGKINILVNNAGTVHRIPSM